MLYKVILKSDGNRKVQAIKIVMNVMNCSLAEGKYKVEHLPLVVIQNIDEQRATKICQEFIAIGCDAILETMENENVPVSFETYTVKLEQVGTEIVKTIKEVREATGLGLKEAKDLVDTAPNIILTGVTSHQATKIRTTLESFGNKVSVTCETKSNSTTSNNITFSYNVSSERCQMCGSTNISNTGFFDKLFSGKSKKCNGCNNKW